jgi:arginine repressor
MPASRITRELARKREQLAFELSAYKGLTEAAIAEELAKQGLGEVTQQAVSKMLRRVEERMVEEMKEQAMRVKVQQTAALRKVYQESMAAWEQSKKPQKSLTTRAGPPGANGEAGAVKESVSLLRDSDGDPRFLEAARQALADIRKIWGADAPQKMEMGGKDGKAIPVQVTGDLLEKARQEMESLFRECLNQPGRQNPLGA